MHYHEQLSFILCSLICDLSENSNFFLYLGINVLHKKQELSLRFAVSLGPQTISGTDSPCNKY